MGPAIPIMAASAMQAGASMYSNASNVAMQGATNEKSIQLAREQREWEENMYNTRHVREVADLRAAGLNPILSANAGGSVPNAAMPTLQAPKMDLDGLISGSAQNYFQNKLLTQQVNTAKSQESVNNATADKLKFQTLSEAFNAKMAENQAKLSDLAVQNLPLKRAAASTFIGRTLAYISGLTGITSPSDGIGTARDSIRYIGEWVK